MSERLLHVWLIDPDGQPTRCGDLLIRDNHLYFRYDVSYIEQGFSLDPLNLPLVREVYRSREFSPPLLLFEDTLPDAWGLAILSRRHRIDFMRKKHEALGLVNTSGVGAIFLAEPGVEVLPPPKWIPMKEAIACFKEVEQFEIRKADIIFRYLGLTGTSAGGARPKAGFRDAAGNIWLVKFPSRNDPHPSTNALVEHAGLMLGRRIGLPVPDTRLVELGRNGMALAVRRFDTITVDTPYWGRKILISFSTLLGGMHMVEGGYENAGLFLRRLVSEPERDVLSFFRWMVLNWHIVNTDDHLKNFSLLWDGESLGLSPAYDLVGNLWGLTRHTMPICGKEEDISPQDLVCAGKKMGLDRKLIFQELERIHAEAEKYLDLIKEAPGTRALVKEVETRLALGLQNTREVKRHAAPSPSI